MINLELHRKFENITHAASSEKLATIWDSLHPILKHLIVRQRDSPNHCKLFPKLAAKQNKTRGCTWKSLKQQRYKFVLYLWISTIVQNSTVRYRYMCIPNVERGSLRHKRFGSGP